MEITIRSIIPYPIDSLHRLGRADPKGTGGIRREMKMTHESFVPVERSLPAHMGNFSYSHVRTAFKFCGSAWRNLAKRFGNGHTVDSRISHYSKAEALDRIFAALHRAHTDVFTSTHIVWTQRTSSCIPIGAEQSKTRQTTPLEIEQRMNDPSHWVGADTPTVEAFGFDSRVKRMTHLLVGEY